MSKKHLFATLILIIFLWGSSQAIVPIIQGQRAEIGAPINAISKNVLAQEIMLPAATPGNSPDQHASWFFTGEGSQWSDEEMLTVQQIMDRTWQALASVGLDGQHLLAGYHFVRVPAEYVPGGDRLLATVDHQKMEIVLGDGAFKRLAGFYIYHELGHAVDRQLGRMPSQVYHRLADATGQAGADSRADADSRAGAATNGDASQWETTTGFWLRYNGRDDREEATADAFAWWVMARAGQPQPFFPGTPVTTDYEDIARTIETALWEGVSTAG